MSAAAPPKKKHSVAVVNAVDDTASLVGHLSELRARIIIVLGAFIVVFALCYWQMERLFTVLSAPLDKRWPIQTLSVTEPFFTSLSVAAQTAFVIVFPLAAWHVWRFIKPAIANEARRTVATLFFTAPFLFLSGVAFCYFLVLGPAVRVLLNLGPSNLHVVVRASDYYSFVTLTLLAVGAAFCFPLVLLGIARIGIIDSTKLRKNRRFAVVAIVVLAAMLPTVDPISLVLEILPLLALYELSILAISLQERRLEKSVE